MALKRNFSTWIVLGVLSAGLAISIVLFMIALTQVSVVSGKLSSKTRVLSGLLDKSNVPLTTSSVSFLVEDVNRFKNVYNRIRLAYLSPLNEEIAPEELDPLQFKERLIQMQKKIREDAGLHELELPDSLGFSQFETELSTPEEIPKLIRRLRILEELVYIMALSEVDVLHVIDFAEKKAVKAEKKPVSRRGRRGRREREGAAEKEELKQERKEAEQKRSGEGTVYSEIPVSFEITCGSSELINFLYKMRSSHYIFVMDELTIDKAADDEAGANEGIGQATSLKVATSVNAVTVY